LELVRQLRAGADFAKVAAANSEREQNGVRIAPQTGGKVGAFEVPSLRAEIADAVKGVPVGGISEPLRLADGYQVLRVDERTAAGSTATFNENQVREAMTMEGGTKARDEYLQSLRDESYIKISDNYADAVYPLLKITPEKTAENIPSGGERPGEKKKKGKLLGIFPKP